MQLLHTARTVCYALFTFWALLTFILAAAFIGRTNHDGFGYSQAAAELIAASLLGMALPVLHFLFHRRNVVTMLGSILVETIAAGVVWLLFLGGAAALSDQLAFLSSGFCDASWCSLGRATTAFAWLSWITLTAMLGLALFDIISASTQNKQAFREPFGAHTGQGVVNKESNTAPTAEMAQQQQQPVHV